MIAAPVLASRVSLARALPPVLGVGAYLKNALCLIQGKEAWISRENGALDNAATIEAFQQTATDILAEAQTKPIAVAHDWHPDFYCTRWAQASGLRTIGIQHHHAHIAAIMAEHGIDEPVLGLALDGFGLGENNQAWGGELLYVDRKGFRRLGHLRELPQPGGDIAARQPWRMGAAALWAMGRGEEIAARYAGFPGAALLPTMMERGLNAPLTSSAGRLFDAACGLLGVVPMAKFEGEAPMALEAMVVESRVDSDGWRLESRRESGIDSSRDSVSLDLRPLLHRLVGMQPVEGAELFHGTLAAALTDWVKKAAQDSGITRIALGGGCFFNKVLRRDLARWMMAEGLEPLWPLQLSPGDPAIALGQAYAAALNLEDGA